MTQSSRFRYEIDLHERDLPDGSCISPRRLVKSLNYEDDHNMTVEVRYAGSFPVVGENQDQRMECVRKMLLEMKNVNKTRPVLLAISLSGIKVCSHTGESILMAHALKRISYATCHPEFRQFSFLAREPKAHTNIQHCHVFLTKSAQEAEELNSVVASAFNVAYACQRQSQVIYQPTFNELIRHQMDLQREGIEEFNRQQQESLAKRLSQIATPLVEQRLEEMHQRRDKDGGKNVFQGKERTCWAKKIFEQSQLDESSRSPVSSTSNLLPVAKSSKDSDSKQNLGDAGVLQPDTGDALVSDRKNSSSGFCDGLPKHVSSVGTEEAYLCPVPCCPGVPGMLSTGSELDFPVCHHLASEKSSNRDDVIIAAGKSSNAPSRPQSGNGETAEQTTGRPLSGKYQNDENGMRTSRDSSRDSEGRDIYQGPPTPIRHDSLRKMTSSQGTLYDELQEAAWYQPGVPREVALEILLQQDIGSFIIRDSTTHPSCYALSVKVPRYDNPSGISHYLITRTSKGSFKIKGLEKEWPTLNSLVTHHTVMRELLPCLLHLPRPSNATSSKDLDKDSNY